MARVPDSRTFAPGPLLARLVNAIDLPLEHGEDGSPAGYTVLPSPQPVLGLQLRGRLALIDGGHPRSLAALGLTGLQTVARGFVPEAGTRTLIMRFKPYGAAALLGPRMADVVDQSVAMDDLLPRPAVELLRERLARARGEAATVAALLAALAAILPRDGATAPAAVRAAADLIVQARGDVGVAALADELGVSVRSLERGFHAYVGLSPKQLGGVARFAWAAEQLRGSADTARVAQEAGFADQAQMSRDFMRRLRVQPSRWRATR